MTKPKMTDLQKRIHNRLTTSNLFVAREIGPRGGENYGVPNEFSIGKVTVLSMIKKRVSEGY